MNIYPKQPRRFAEKDMEVLSSFFDQATRARVRANLFRELEKEITEIKKVRFADEDISKGKITHYNTMS